ncbi:hypothetical protein ACWCPM_23810 [Streptomyces sp. NPDC002309]
MTNNYTLNDLDRVRSEAGRARLALEVGPRPEPLARFPRGACRLTSLALAAHLKRSGLGEWQLHSGVRVDNVTGAAPTHAWLERGPLLLDITADQFDALPLRLGPVFLGTSRRWHDQFEQFSPVAGVPREHEERAGAAIAWLAHALRRPAVPALQTPAPTAQALPREEWETETGHDRGCVRARWPVRAHPKHAAVQTRQPSQPGRGATGCRCVRQSRHPPPGAGPGTRRAE